jgi:hypothetical protein
LKPLLQFIQRRIDQHIIKRIDPDFMFEFVGLEEESASELADLNTKLVKSTRTIDELRALEDLPPLPNGLGDIILDATYLQHAQQSAQAAQGTGAFAPPQQDGEFGDEGQDGEPSPFDQLKNEFGQDDGDETDDAETKKSLKKSVVPKKKFHLEFTL